MWEWEGSCLQLDSSTPPNCLLRLDYIYIYMHIILYIYKKKINIYVYIYILYLLALSLVSGSQGRLAYACLYGFRAAR